MKKSVAAALAAVFIFCGCQKKSAERSAFFAMDTFCTVVSQSDTEQIEKVINTCSYNLDAYSGELYSFNENTFTKNEYIYDITKKTFALNDEFGDSVDITSGALTILWGISSDSPAVPEKTDISIALDTIGRDEIVLENDTVKKPLSTKLDFGAVAKGYACDLVYSECEKAKTDYAIVSLGSSSLLYGKKQDGSDFRIEIKNPDGDAPLGMITTSECFVSTSGGYERFFEADGKKYCHILDTKTGYPTESDLVSVTVICYGENGGIKSDFLATDIFLGGTKNLEKHLARDDYKIVAADKNKKLYVSSGLDFEINRNSGYSL